MAAAGERAFNSKASGGCMIPQHHYQSQRSSLPYLGGVRDMEILTAGSPFRMTTSRHPYKKGLSFYHSFASESSRSPLWVSDVASGAWSTKYLSDCQGLGARSAGFDDDLHEMLSCLSDAKSSDHSMHGRAAVCRSACHRRYSRVFAPSLSRSVDVGDF
jgi:hypothetical protein